jgi:putative transposase
VHKRHNVSVLLSQVVGAAKERRGGFSAGGEEVLREACWAIAPRDERVLGASGTDRNHGPWLLQSVPTDSPTKRGRTGKSLTARQVLARAPEVKRQVWGGEFGGKGDFLNTVGQHGNEKGIATYIRKPGQETAYKQLHKQPLQLEWFCIAASQLAARQFTHFATPHQTFPGFGFGAFLSHKLEKLRAHLLGPR